jgi:hypothetical protein
MVLLISYDLNGQERPDSYTRVASKVKEKAVDWRRPLYSQWFVETTQDPASWVEWLKPLLDNNDRLFVDRITSARRGMLPQADWDWLKSKGL